MHSKLTTLLTNSRTQTEEEYKKATNEYEDKNYKIEKFIIGAEKLAFSLLGVQIFILFISIVWVKCSKFIMEFFNKL